MSSDTTCDYQIVAVWTFRRRSQRLTLQQERDGSGRWFLLVNDDSQPRTYSFSDVDRLVGFQSSMEGFLVRTGWLLESFWPERRRGRDRRRMPRVENDRRRWWTDPIPKP